MRLLGEFLDTFEAEEDDVVQFANWQELSDDDMDYLMDYAINELQHYGGWREALIVAMEDNGYEPYQ